MTHVKGRIGSETSSAKGGKIAGLYDLEETIGKGHFAVVKLARHVFTGERVAVKVIDKLKLDDVSRAHLYQEVRCMKLVQHPHVVRLYEVIDTQTKLYLILELGDGGDMYDYIMKHRNGLPEDVAQKYFVQILEAISYCHKLHVVHRDLKPENVVFFEKLGIVKLTDFGFSNLFHPGEKLDTSCGSLAYSAPEILLGDSYEAPAVDIWSLGVILYMLVAGDPPFQEANDSETLTMILDCKYKKPPHLSSECLDLISKMLVREPSKRACLSDILNHVWLRWPKAKLNSAEGTPQEATCGCCPLHLNSASMVARNPVELLSEKERSSIIQKMINGKIATKDEIIDSITKNNYNHITATYYLLAERKLRKEREHANRGEQSSGSTTPRAHSGGKTSHGASPIRGNSPARGGLGSPGTFSKELRGSLGLSPGRRDDSSSGSGNNTPVSKTTPIGRCSPLSSIPPRSAIDTLISPPGSLPAHPNAPGEVRKVFGPRPPVSNSGTSGRFQLTSCTEETPAPTPHPSSHVERPLRREIHAVKSSPQLLNDVIEEGSESGDSSEEDLSDGDLTAALGAPLTYHTIGSGTPSRKALASGSSSNLGSPDILRSTKMFERKLSSQHSSRTSSRISSESDHSDIDASFSTSGCAARVPTTTTHPNPAAPSQGIGSWPRRQSSSPKHPVTARSVSRGSCGHVTLSTPPSTSVSLSNGAAGGHGGQRSRHSSIASDSGSVVGNGAAAGAVTSNGAIPVFLNNNWSVANGDRAAQPNGQTSLPTLSSNNVVSINHKGSISNISNISLSSDKSASKYIVDSKKMSPRATKNLCSQRHSPSLDQVYEERCQVLGQPFNDLDRLSERLSLGKNSNSSFHTSASLNNSEKGFGAHVWTTASGLISEESCRDVSLNGSGGRAGSDFSAGCVAGEGSFRAGAVSGLSDGVVDGVCCGGKAKKVWRESALSKKKIPSLSCCAVS